LSSIERPRIRRKATAATWPQRILSDIQEGFPNKVYTGLLIPPTPSVAQNMNITVNITSASIGPSPPATTILKDPTMMNYVSIEYITQLRIPYDKHHHPGGV